MRGGERAPSLHPPGPPQAPSRAMGAPETGRMRSAPQRAPGSLAGRGLARAAPVSPSGSLPWRQVWETSRERAAPHQARGARGGNGGQRQPTPAPPGCRPPLRLDSLVRNCGRLDPNCPLLGSGNSRGTPQARGGGSVFTVRLPRCSACEAPLPWWPGGGPVPETREECATGCGCKRRMGRRSQQLESEK